MGVLRTDIWTPELLLFSSSATLSTATIDEDDIKMNFGETGLREMDLGGSGSCPVMLTFLSLWFQKYSTSRCNISANISLLNWYIPVFHYILMSEVVRTGFMRKIATWAATVCTPVDLRMFQRNLLAPIIDPEHRDSRFLWNMWSSEVHSVTRFYFKSNLLKGYFEDSNSGTLLIRSF